MNYKELEDKIYNYPTKYPQGFIQSEVIELLKEYPACNMDRFNNNFMGNTCQLSPDNEIINYHVDVFNALRAGLTNTNIPLASWD